MTDDAARRTHVIFMKALDVDAAKREAFVSTNCSGDAPLERRVRRLIAAMDRSGGFLEVPALGPHAADQDQRPAIDPAAISVRGYRIVRPIGAGGMATVYEAVQESPHRTVALKVMSRALTNTSAVRRFRYETETLARLQHPGIAQIFEAGTCDDGHGHPLPFFAMELVAGARTITDHAQHHALPLHDRLRLFIGVCDAVQHGHQLGVIHRDLKPGNILVDGSGRVKIIDFGVARSTESGDARLTRRADLGELIGTLNFMSPEQCAGSADVDARTDVYSLGVVLYELIAERLPHELGRVSIPEAVRIIAEDAPAKLGALVPEARGDLEAIALKTLEKQRAMRYSSAAALATDIQRYLNHQTIEARSPSVVHKMKLFTKRHRVLVGVGSALLLTLIAASISIGVFAYRAAEESNRRRIAEQAALEDRDLALRQAYVASIAGAFSSAQASDYAQARRRLNMADRSLRNWEWSLASALIERGERTVRVHDDMVFAFSLSEDSKRVATGSRDGGLAVWDTATWQNLRCGPALGTPVYSVAFHPDGRRVFVGVHDHTIRLWDCDAADDLRVFAQLGAPVDSVACSPAGFVAAASHKGEARLWDIDAQLLRAFDDQPGGVHGVVFSHDGLHLVTWNSRGSVWVRSGDGSAVRHRLDLGVAPECVGVSPDGALLAAGGAEGRLRIWRISDGSEFASLPGPTISNVRSLAFSPDSRWLATGQIDRSIRIWDVRRASLHDVRLGHEEAVSGLAFNPTADHLYSASWDGTIRNWPIGAAAPPGAYRMLHGHDGNVLAVAFSPDGSLIASGGRDDAVRLYDGVLGQQLVSLEAHGGDVLSVAFSPDGALLASGSADGKVRLWTIAPAGKSEETLGTGGPSIWSVTFSPDGRFLACAGDEGVVRVWNLASRSMALEFAAHDKRITTVRYSPDGAIIATCSRDTSVRLWNAATGTHRQTLNHHRLDVFALAFSKDGSRLYSGSRDQTVGVWETQTGKWIQPLDTQGQLIASLAVSPDGTRLAAGSWFAEVVLWDTATHDLVASFKGHDSAIRSLAFSPDGSSLLCSGHDGALTLHSAKPRLERSQDFERSCAARDAAGAAIERHADEEPGAMLGKLEQEFRENPEARRWARNLLFVRSVIERAPATQPSEGP